MNERKVKPLSPDEVAAESRKDIPHLVIEAVNNLLIKKVCGGRAVIKQSDISLEIQRLAKVQGEPVTSQQIYDNGWLDFEPLFERVGWAVVYDKPAYNESYPATFEFTRKNKP